jgi:hypothetical protein
VDHSDKSAPDLIDQIYRLQVSLSILAEQLARAPESKPDLTERAIDYLYLTNWHLDNQMNTRRH